MYNVRVVFTKQPLLNALRREEGLSIMYVKILLQKNLESVVMYQTKKSAFMRSAGILLHRYFRTTVQFGNHVKGFVETYQEYPHAVQFFNDTQILIEKGLFHLQSP